MHIFNHKLFKNKNYDGLFEIYEVVSTRFKNRTY